MSAARVSPQETRYAKGVFLLFVYPQVHRLYASEQEPGVERAQPGTLRILEKINLKKQTNVWSNGRNQKHGEKDMKY